MATEYKLSYTANDIDNKLKKIDQFKSAYDYAKDGGYTGAESDFANDINPDNIKAKATPIKGVDYFDGLDATPVVPLFANNISECTDTTMPYVLPDGYIYAYLYSEIPIENENLWTSGDLDVSRYYTTALFIPAGEYEVSLKVASTDTDSIYNSINFYNDEGKVGTVSFTRDSLQTEIITLSSDVTKIYFYASSDATKSEGDTATYTDISIVSTVVNSTPDYRWTNTGHAFVRADYEDRIFDLEDEMAAISEYNDDVLTAKDIVARSQIDDMNSDVEYIQNINLYDGATISGRFVYTTGTVYNGTSTHMRNENPIKLDVSKGYNIAVKSDYVKGTLYLYTYDDSMTFIEMKSNTALLHVSGASYINFHIADYSTNFPEEPLHVMVWECDDENETYKEWLEYGDVGSYYKNNLKIPVQAVDELMLPIYKARFDDSFNYVAYSQVVGSAGDINTTEHFKWAAQQGFTALKGDVQPTSDGHLVMCHDAGFTLNESGYITSYNVDTATPIHDMTLEECLSLQHSGSYLHVCSFDNYIKICKKYGKIAYITIRDEYIDEAISAMFSVLNKYNMRTRCIINSFTLETLQAVRAVDSTITLSQVLSSGQKITTTNIDIAVSLGNCQICGFDFPSFGRFDDISDDVVTYAKEKDIRLYQAQVNSMDDIDMLIEYGISGAHMTIVPTFD